MKMLLAICLTLTVAFAHAADKPAAGNVIKGEVVETMDSAGFTYLRLKTRDGESWAAVRQTPVKAGAQVTIENVTVMQNFESKTLKKTFPTIYFGNLPGAQGNPHAGGMDAANPHAGLSVSKPVDVGDVRVPKATGANARTVAEVVTKSGELKDKPVLVRGKVVKYNDGIMGKNWIHLRDGSGSNNDNSNDILVTSTNPAAVGDVVTVEGVVRTDKDFGSGYAYKVMIEDAKLKK